MTKLSMSEEEMLKRKYTKPYEKRIEELEQENNKLLDVINNQDVKIAGLEKENAELRNNGFTVSAMTEQQLKVALEKGEQLEKENEELKEKSSRQSKNYKCDVNKLLEENAELKDHLAEEVELHLHAEDYIKSLETENNKLLDVINNQDVKIADLEQKLEQTGKDLADYQFNYPKIKELEKTNKLLGERCNQLLKDKGELIDKVEKMKCCCNCDWSNYQPNGNCLDCDGKKNWKLKEIKEND